MSVSVSRLAVVLLAVCLAGAAAAPAVSVADEHDGDNGTVHHENPDEVGSDGDLDAVRRWLDREMTEIHIDCAENLSLGESAACERLDEDYPDYLSRYGSVERDLEGDNGTQETFDRLRENQTALAEAYTEFNETYDEYRSARNAGDDERARELARELQRLAERIDELGGNVVVQFRTLESATGADTGPARNATNETVVQVANITRTVERETFTTTVLTVTVDPQRVSFREPGTVEGRLTDENGSAIANGSIRLVVDGRTVATTVTDANGTFEATYRPVTTSTGPTSVGVEYVPSVRSAFLGTNATASVTVAAVSPDLSIATAPDRVAFGDPVTATGTVSVDGTALESVRIGAYLGEERIAVGRTDGDGRFDLTGTVPASVPDGVRNLTIVASAAGQAVTPVEERRRVVVEETSTDLRMNATVDDGVLVVGGRLRTADGVAVPSREIRVTVDDQRATVVTDSAGRYDARIPVDPGAADRWRASAAFDGAGTNLGPATERRTVESPRSTGLVSRLAAVLTDNPLLSGLTVLFAILDVVLVGLVVRRYRRHREPSGAPASDDEPAVTGGTAPAPDVNDEAPGGAPVSRGPDPLEVARDRLESGAPAEAVRAGYGAVRSGLGGGEGDTRTHREFYRDVTPTLPESDGDALATLTEAYERAAFAPSGVDETTAASALDAAAQCLDGRPATDGGTDERR